MKFAARPLALGLLLSVMGCTDLPTPAELVRPAIVAVRADPPAIAAGGRATLSVFVAGPSGLMTPDSVTWTTAAENSIQPIGRIELEDSQLATFVAPDNVTEPAIGMVRVAVNVAGSETLVALKGVGVGFARQTSNPTITDLIVAGQNVADRGTARVRRGTTIDINATLEPPANDDTAFAWYTTAGEIELYRRAPTELAPLEEVAQGTLLVVVRDGRGGVALRSATLMIE